MGALPPFEAPFQTPESPPLPRAEALCSLPACSNKSFAFGTGGRTHPSPYAGRHEVRTRYPPLRAYPGLPSSKLSGGGHDLRTPKPLAGPYGGKGENEAFSLVAPPCDPVPTSPSVPKAKLLLEHEDTGRRAQGIITEGIEPSGKTQNYPPHFHRRRAFPLPGPSPMGLPEGGLTIRFAWAIVTPPRLGDGEKESVCWPMWRDASSKSGKTAASC